MNTPPVGTYDIDPTHTTATASIRHLGLSKVRGTIPVESGTIHIAENPTESSVNVTLTTSGVNTGNADRDGHLQSDDFLDVENYPHLEYRAEPGSVTDNGDGTWTVNGELTIKDTTRPVALNVEFEGTGQDPWGNSRAAFTASAEFDREDFGITWNQALETGGVLVGKTIKVDLDVQGVKHADTDS